MNYFFILLLTFFLGNCFTIYMTVKHIVPANFKIAFTLILIGLSAFMYSYVIYSRYFSENFSYEINQILAYIVYYFMAFIIYGEILYIVAFIGNLLLKSRTDITLYKFVIPIVVILLVIGTYFKKVTVVKEYEINSEGKFKKPINIALISDIHLGYINGNSSMENLVKKVNSLNPDLVLVAGDTVDMHLKPVLEKNMLENFKNIKSRYGVFINIGNHDIYGGKVKEFTNKLNSYKNINVLRDGKILIDDSFYVASRDNYSKQPLSEILKDSEEKPVLYMQHTPDTIDEVVKNKVFLQVSGHTHKGQFFPGSLFTKKIFKLDYGYKKFQDTNVVVSSGYGTWGPPIRIGTQSEIVLIKIK